MPVGIMPEDIKTKFQKFMGENIEQITSSLSSNPQFLGDGQSHALFNQRIQAQFTSTTYLVLQSVRSHGISSAISIVR
jgi:hypothetical protein